MTQGAQRLALRSSGLGAQRLALRSSGLGAQRLALRVMGPSAAALALALGVAGGLARPAAGQSPPHPAPVSEVADVPAGPAALRGRVIHGDDPARAAGVEVLLYALPANAPPGVRRGTSDAEGRFVFEGISNDPETAYLIGARHGGVPFPGARVTFVAGETAREVDVRIGEATTDPGGVEVSEVQIRLAWRGATLGVIEVHRLANRGTRTVFVPAEARDEAQPAFETRLPAGATGVDVPLGIAPEGLVVEPDAVRFYGPVYPSAWPDVVARDQGISFHYTVSAPGAGGAPLALRKPFARGAGRVVVMAPEGGPAVRVEGARDEGLEDVEGRPHRRFVVSDLAAGAMLALAADVPATRADRSALTLEEARLFLELDDAALLVREEHKLRVAGDTALVAPPGEPLLELPLPEGAAELRFDRSAFEHGLAPGERGGAVLDGPLPPGETVLEIAYHLPIAEPGAGIAFERRFGAPLPLLSLFVADTGMRLTSERLHRRRPVASSDRTFLHLEAFQVEPAETVRLALAPLPAAAGLPRAAGFALLALLAALAAAFLGAPLRGVPSAGAEDLEDEALDAARREREAVYAALRDLDHDHETAKVSEADYESMRRELRGRAAALLQAERATPASPAPAATPSGAACAACGAASRPDDRFCARCGARLAGPAEVSA